MRTAINRLCGFLYIFIWVFIILVLLCIGFYLGRIYESGVERPLPTIEYIQKRLGCEKVDGKLCDGWKIKVHSETQEKWDLAYANESAEKFMTKSGGPK